MYRKKFLVLGQTLLRLKQACSLYFQSSVGGWVGFDEMVRSPHTLQPFLIRVAHNYNRSIINGDCCMLLSNGILVLQIMAPLLTRIRLYSRKSWLPLQQVLICYDADYSGQS